MGNRLILSQIFTMKKSFLLIAFCCLYTIGQAQKEDKKLKALIETAISGFQGDIGIYIQHLKKNKYVAVNADTIFPTASIVKVPILVV